jgi:folate-binding protein YgfZ
MPDSVFYDGSVSLAHWGVIRASGPDAAAFLQGQLTNDVQTLDRSHARLAGYCSAKGRLLASFVVWRNGPEEVLLACSADLLAATLKRLSMFVLRSKCKLTDASSELRLIGHAGSAAQALVSDMPEWRRSERNGKDIIRLPDAEGVARCLHIADVAFAPPSLPLSLEAWSWLEVSSGIPTIVAATVDQLVPQMLNYELLRAVDFQKGCYPGQEVVARSQYRGTIKRRTFMFDVAAAAEAGQELFYSADPGQPCGMVVNAARWPVDPAVSRMLAEVKLQALGDGSLHLGSPQGARLERRELPYDVPVETA